MTTSSFAVKYENKFVPCQQKVYLFSRSLQIRHYDTTVNLLWFLIVVNKHCIASKILFTDCPVQEKIKKLKNKIIKTLKFG